MALLGHPTRSEPTKTGYVRRTRDLVRRCRTALGLHAHEELDFRRFVGWLVLHKPEWSRPTWRQYKAAAVYVLETHAEQGHAVAQEALETLLPIDVEGCTTTTRKTSAQKLKKLPLRDYRAIHQWLSDHKGPWNADVQRWLAAGLLTGLRPREWGQCVYTTRLGEDALVVRNAKATNQRAHGVERTVLLGGLSDEERAMIRAHVDRATEWAAADRFAHFYHGCAAGLSRASRALWPKRDRRATLYSARHQFSADAKASGLAPEELAALMGHAVDTTAGQHYGRKAAGMDMLRVRPDPQDVAKVRIAFSHRTAPPSPSPQATTAPTLRPADRE